ncbi:hypothetical protein [Leucobacter luti]|uniref:Ribosomally synthesized peptide with SipW-like signal peptide n=1 Tax=Leucobacter luti TaxID=340320 RepID=A0A4Q7TKC2_9MICO|nr:hypothetical protein [Leucobacter luti]MBL3700211.1 hypothetical protein [Leucobacter luti]RZT61066.1 hypothetical protein EV139_2813 [Leucobacter luti]
MGALRTGHTRAFTAAWVLLGTAILASVAAITDARDSLTVLDGSQNRLDLRVAGSPEPGWHPQPAMWEQGSPAAYRIRLTPDDSALLVGPGSSLSLRIAVRNDSPRLASAVQLSITDPVDRGSEVDPATGSFVELFPQLRFTVADGDRALAEAVPATELERIQLPGAVAAGKHRVLDVMIEVPPELDNRWQRASTDVQFTFEGTSQ